MPQAIPVRRIHRSDTAESRACRHTTSATGSTPSRPSPSHLSGTQHSQPEPACQQSYSSRVLTCQLPCPRDCEVTLRRHWKPLTWSRSTAAGCCVPSCVRVWPGLAACLLTSDNPSLRFRWRRPRSLLRDESSLEIVEGDRDRELTLSKKIVSGSARRQVLRA